MNIKIIPIVDDTEESLLELLSCRRVDNTNVSFIKGDDIFSSILPSFYESDGSVHYISYDDFSYFRSDSYISLFDIKYQGRIIDRLIYSDDGKITLVDNTDTGYRPVVTAEELRNNTTPSICIFDILSRIRVFRSQLA